MSIFNLKKDRILERLKDVKTTLEYQKDKVEELMKEIEKRKDSKSLKSDMRRKTNKICKYLNDMVVNELDSLSMEIDLHYKSK